MDLVSITGALQSIPAGMQNRMQQAASRLIGAVAKIPKAWIDAKAQSITDRAAASHAMQKALVEASKKHLKTDNELIDATIEAYLPDAIRKCKNKAVILIEAAENLSEDKESSKSQGAADVSDLDEDWLNMFARQAEDASSERMQILLGKLLAGEIRRPKSFSPSTLRLVAEMDQEMATDLQRMSDLTVGDAIFTDDTWNSGEKFVFSTRLSISGFTTDAVGQVNRTYQMNAHGRAVVLLGSTQLHIQASPNLEINSPILLLTKSAQQLKLLIPKPTNHRNVYVEVARRIKNANAAITAMHLIFEDGNSLVI